MALLCYFLLSSEFGKSIKGRLGIVYTGATMQEHDNAPRPEDPDRAERKISTKFLNGLWRHEGLKHDDLNDWQYGGGDYREYDGYKAHAEFKRQFILACPWPEYKTSCVCDTVIIYNHFVANRARDRVIVVGKCCIDKFLGPNRKRCEVCYNPHRKRGRNLCDACIKKHGVCSDCHENLEWGDRYRDEGLCVPCKDDRCRYEDEKEQYEYEMALLKVEEAKLRAKQMKLEMEKRARERALAPKPKWVECPKCKIKRRQAEYRLCSKCRFA